MSSKLAFFDLPMELRLIIYSMIDDRPLPLRFIHQSWDRYPVLLCRREDHRTPMGPRAMFILAQTSSLFRRDIEFLTTPRYNVAAVMKVSKFIFSSSEAMSDFACRNSWAIQYVEVAMYCNYRGLWSVSHDEFKFATRLVKQQRVFYRRGTTTFWSIYRRMHTLELVSRTLPSTLGEIKDLLIGCKLCFEGKIIPGRGRKEVKLVFLNSRGHIRFSTM